MPVGVFVRRHRHGGTCRHVPPASRSNRLRALPPTATQLIERPKAPAVALAWRETMFELTFKLTLSYQQGLHLIALLIALFFS